MGLFSSKKITYVASSVWNMAGDYPDRTNYLRFLLSSSAALSSSSYADDLSRGTLDGPRMNYGVFYRWASKNYPHMTPVGGRFNVSQVVHNDVHMHIPGTPGWQVIVQEAFTDIADFQIWAEKYMYDNHPTLTESGWRAEVISGNQIRIWFEDTSTVTFTPSGFIPGEQYLYARYTERTNPATSENILVSSGSVVGPLPNPSFFPLYYWYDNKTEAGIPRTLYKHTHTLIEYSNGDPDEEDDDWDSTTTTTPRDVDFYGRYNGTVPDPSDPQRLWKKLETRCLWTEPLVEEVVTQTVTEEEIEDPNDPLETITKTTTVTVTEDVFSTSQFRWYYQDRVYKTDSGAESKPKLFIYRRGTGNAALDAIIGSRTTINGFFPVIPLRIDNKFITEPPYDTSYYPEAKKVYKRATSGAKIDKILETLADNESIGDIDYAFIMYGVPLNTKSKEQKQYVFEFFKRLIPEFSGSFTEYFNLISYNTAYQAYLQDMEAWRQSAGEYSQPAQPRPPDPSRLGFSSPKKMVINLSLPGAYSFVNMYLSFNCITHGVSSGKYRPEAKTGDVWIEKDGTTTVVPSVVIDYAGDDGIPVYSGAVTDQVIKITYQVGTNTYETVRVYGLSHQNVVYNNTSVFINAFQALDDEDDSGLFIPLHWDSLKRLPLVRANQVCTESQLVIINSYQIVKKKWYQRGIFKVVVAIVTVAISVMFPPAGGLMAGAGVLGANVAIGSMLGLTGMAAAIAGAVVNAIANMILMNIISQGLSKILGPKFAAILSLALTVTGANLGGMFTGEGITFDFNVFMKAENLLKITNAATNAYAVILQEKTMGIYSEMEALNAKYEKEMQEIQARFEELGYYTNGFDPMMLTSVVQSVNESRDTFLSRTLLTGSDIAAMSHGMITDFSAITLDLNNTLG